MHKKFGLQRQITEIFGDTLPLKKRHHPKSRTSRPKREMPHSPDSRTRQPDRLPLTALVEPDDINSRGKAPKLEVHKAIPEEALSGSHSVQVLEQKYRSPGSKSVAAKLKGRIKIAIILLLATVLVWQLVRMSYSGTGEVLDTTDVRGAKTETAGRSQPNIAWPVPRVYPQDVRDPMEWGPKPAMSGSGVEVIAAATADTSKWTVRGIVYSEDKPSAIIGTQIVQEGDEILGATVVKIGRRTVEFEINGKRWFQEVENHPE